MTPEDRSRLLDLLTRQRLLALAVVVDAEPVVALMPFAYDRDRAALYVQASRLGRHSQGLKADAVWSGVIHEPDTPETDALQVPRLVVDGRVEPLRGDQPDFPAAARAFVSRFPGAAMTLALPDFSLYRLAVEGGRLILGFGAALNLSRSHFEDIAKA